MNSISDKSPQDSTDNEPSDEMLGVFKVSEQKGISRREFLRLSIFSAAALLVSCNNKGFSFTPPPTPTAVPPTPTAVPPTPTAVPPTPTGAPLTPATNLPTIETSVPSEIASEIKFRRGPSTSSELIGTLPAGLPISLIGRSKDSLWLEGRLSNGVTGWVLAAFFGSSINIRDLAVSTRSATVPAALLSSDGDLNVSIEDVAQETIQTLVEEAIEAAADAIDNELSSDTITLPCVPGAIPPGYICVCNCV